MLIGIDECNVISPLLCVHHLQRNQNTMSLVNVEVAIKANVYFDGKCISHTVTLEDKTRKSIGVILPSTLRFDLTTKETMIVFAGEAFVSINGLPEVLFSSGQSWVVEAGGYFIIRVEEPLHYVCHFE